MTPPAHLEAIRSLAKSAGAGPDDDIGQLIAAMGAWLSDIATTQAELRTIQKELPGPAIIAAFKRAALDVSPQAEREYRWRRWCMTTVAGAVGLGVVVMLGLVVWGIPMVRMATQCAEVFEQGGGTVCQVRYWIKTPAIVK
jgi:hypothetical protein